MAEDTRHRLVKPGLRFGMQRGHCNAAVLLQYKEGAWSASVREANNTARAGDNEDLHRMQYTVARPTAFWEANRPFLRLLYLSLLEYCTDAYSPGIF